MCHKRILLLSVITLAIVSTAISANTLTQYTENNRANVSFDVSMPIDATGYTLHGKNLTSGHIQFTDRDK